ncbi:lasso peptide biosynthesis B2 protein [Cytobacillus sp. S13-E01]|uniref:lasso peptide biosynthesis B2 protein n=1 Tax=Cytobacillus sp. S13-E01 TaxID=3031326 RepID=UPI0023D85CC7|nr:lasso peptide biosynthesis B2 protein [Cytobacillus sp. S13-E01]MDF0727752.1 lasso peptide biosynthesis B2 protein [Cytobacillus sp. S13-E01]
MTTIKKLGIFLKLDNNTKLLMLESFISLGCSRVIKAMPFKKVINRLGMYEEETSFTDNDLDKKIIKSVSQAIDIMSRYTYWESKCLVKAIAAMKMLERRDIESTLYLGIAKDESGKLIAHAWLRSGSYYISGSEGMERFTVVGIFAKKISSSY